jgi:hypothetical protein
MGTRGQGDTLSLPLDHIGGTLIGVEDRGVRDGQPQHLNWLATP